MRIKKVIVFLVLFIALLSSAFAVGTAPDPDDTVAYWKWEDLTDETANGYDWTATLADSGATGIINNAYDYTASNTDYAYTPNNYDFIQNTGTFTINTWVKLDDYTDAGGQTLLGTTTGSSAQKGWLLFLINGGDLKFWISRGGAWTNQESVSSAISDNDFNMVTVTGDGTNLRLYVNRVNVLNTTFGTLSTGAGTNSNMRAGALLNDAYLLDGIQDETAIFDVAITQDNIDYLYQSGSPTSAQQYDFSGEEPVLELNSLYLDPNSSVTIDTTVDAVANFNQSYPSAYVYTKTYVNGVLDDTDTGNNNLTSSSYTFEAFSSGEFVGNDELIASFAVVNGSNTSDYLIAWTNTSTLTVDNTAPNASQATIEPSNPQTFEGLNATCLVEDRDGDSFDILIEIYKNTVLQGSETTASKTLVSGNVYKGTVAIANTSTSTGDSYQVKCRGYDGTDYGTQIAGSLYTIIEELMTTTVTATETSPISHNSDFNFSTSSTYATANTSFSPDYTLTDVYKNGVFFKNSTTIYANETAINDNFTFYSYVSYDGRKVSNTKSITVNIGNTAPSIDSAYLLPTPPQDADNLLTYCQIDDIDNDDMNLTYTIYRNGVSLATGSYNNLNNGTYNVYNVTNSSTSVDDVFIVECIATDSYLTSSLNSSVYTILEDDLTVELVSDNAEFVLPDYYARSLDYVVRYNNCTTSGVANLYVNNASVRSLSFNCDASGEDYYFNGTYQHSSEENVTLLWSMNLTNGTSYDFDKDYIFDLFPPTATITPQQINNGFGGNNNVTIRLTCSDSLYSPLTYEYYVNTSLQFNTSYANNYQYNESRLLPDGQTNLTFNCYDLFSSDTDTYTYNAYTKSFILIDEVTANEFDISNLTYARLWFGDNSTYYDFVNNSENNVTVTSTEITDLRFVYELSDGSVITRFIDMQYLPDEDLKICTNKDNVEHYEQLYTASSNKPVIVKNQYADCYIAADETKFAYQDSLILRAFTIDSTYYLYTYRDGSQVFLSSLDGSVQSAVSIDVLEFSEEAYNFNILQSAVAFQETDGGDIKVQYVNDKQDNDEITVTITRLDTNEQVFTTSSVDDPNEFNLIFSTSSLSGVTSSTLFKIVFVAEKTDGTTQTLTRYFNNSGSSGTLNPTFAAVFAVVLVFFGLSLAVTRVSFSWFGIVILLGALTILGATTAEFYIIVLQAAISIALVFTVIVMYKSNSETIS